MAEVSLKEEIPKSTRQRAPERSFEREVSVVLVLVSLLRYPPLNFLIHLRVEVQELVLEKRTG